MAPPSVAELVNRVEASLFLLTEVPGIVDDLHIGGITGRESPYSDPELNLVGLARLGPKNADETIRNVRDRFVASQRTVGWVVGPSCRPTDLGDRLRAAGFVEAAAFAGMVRTHVSGLPAPHPDVAIRESSPEEIRAMVPLVAHAYGTPVDVARAFADSRLAGGDRAHWRQYAAYVPGVSGPVAYANLAHLPDGSTVLLGGAATLPAYRGRGIYTALVVRRLQDAWADGARVAIIHANRTTSAQICANLGFEEIAAFDMFCWRAEDVARAQG